jgi:DNA polymerase III alpha subunit
MAVSIHTHSDASAKDGVARIDNHIIPRLQQIGMPAAAITDHDVVANHIEFHDKMREADLHPVLGIEAYQTIYPRQVCRSTRLCATRSLVTRRTTSTSSS